MYPPRSQSLTDLFLFSYTGLLADKTGDYVYSFYMTGGSLLVAFLIPLVLVVIKYKQSRVHPQNIEEGDKKEATRNESEA